MSNSALYLACTIFLNSKFCASKLENITPLNFTSSLPSLSLSVEGGDASNSQIFVLEALLISFSIYVMIQCTASRNYKRAAKNGPKSV